MNIVTVTPLVRGILKDTLTYFSSRKIIPGSIVVVPIKNRPTEALVLESQPASDLKSQLKQSDFALKKIIEIKSEHFFLPTFLQAAVRLAEYNALPLGQVISCLVPKAVLEQAHKLTVSPSSEELHWSDQEKQRPLLQNKYLLQDQDEDRLSQYKGIIREAFARKESVFLCLPTIRDVERVAQNFGRGIQDYTIILHSELSQKKQIEEWKRALDSTHPVLLVGTPFFLSIPRGDLRTIIIDRENNPGYKNMVRPFIDFRRFAEYYADAAKIKIIFGDLVLRTETILRSEKNDFQNLASLKYRASSDAEQSLFVNQKMNEGQKKFFVISPELENVLRQAVDNRQKVFILSGRKGLAPTTVCNDCGQIISCPRCACPLVLHNKSKHETEPEEIPDNGTEEKSQQFFYLCHKCGFHQEAENSCPRCQGWRLSLLGFGLEKVSSELQHLFPDIPHFIINKEAGTPKTIHSLIEKFHSTKGPAFLLGTEVIIPYLNEPIDHVVAVSLDALFSVPDFRMGEKILNLLLKVRQWARKTFSIQTRNPDEKVYGYALGGNLLDFYRDEIAERLKFKYPPFRTLIKISIEGSTTEVESQTALLEKTLQEWEPLIVPAVIDRPRNKHRQYLLLRLLPEQWPNAKLGAIFRQQPPNVTIDIEPESIL